MAEDRFDTMSRQVPTGRLSRLTILGKLAGGVAGGMMAEGARRLAVGERLRISDLLLTPSNALKLADRLSHLRGAAMKLGQMISMDAGDILPAELSAVLARLRDNGHSMPPTQLAGVLSQQWGPDWKKHFSRFDAQPIAAASIGQVHRATSIAGQDLAIKVQYPGIANSIDADVDNVAALLRVSGLLPRSIDIAPLLSQAKRQLHEEADYLREGEQMERFGSLLANTAEVAVPQRIAHLTTDRILTMSFLPGEPIEALAEKPQDVRNAAMSTLFKLVLRELFEFGIMQTDPNFANYRYQPESGRIVLLDFGAVRSILPATAQAYGTLLIAGLSGDRDRIRGAAVATGFLGDAAVRRHQNEVDAMIDAILEAFNRPGPFDFGNRSFVGTVREQAAALAADRETWHVPPVETLFAQRKISGTALLAARLKARVDVRSMIADSLPGWNVGLAPTL